jgi:hypothetical protein
LASPGLPVSGQQMPGSAVAHAAASTQSPIASGAASRVAGAVSRAVVLPGPQACPPVADRPRPHRAEGRVKETHGVRARFLPEATFAGRQNARLQYAVLAAAAVHGGTEPDLLDEVASWQADDFWQYAMYAAVACIRAAASRAGVPVRQACQDLGDRPRRPAP